MAGPWDNVQLPKPPDLQPPRVDFAPLGDLGNAYYQGQTQQRQLAVQNALQDKSLYNPDGTLNINAGVQKLLSLGAIDQAQNLYAVGQMQKPPPSPLPDPYNTPPPPRQGAGASVSVPTSTGIVRAPVNDPNLSPSEQITPRQAAVANQPLAQPIQPSQATAANQPPAQPIQPVPVTTVPVRAVPDPGFGSKVAPPSGAPTNAAADALMPPSWLAAGYHAPDYRSKLQELIREQNIQIAAIEHQNAYSKTYKRDTGGLKAQVDNWEKRVEEINQALGPNDAMKTAAASNMASPLDYQRAEEQQKANIQLQRENATLTPAQKDAMAAGQTSPLAATVEQKKQEAAITSSQPTEIARQARDAGFVDRDGRPDVIGYQRAQEQQKADIAARQQETQKQSDDLVKLAQLGLDAKGRSTALDAIRDLGREVGYGIIPEFQKKLGEYGIPTKGLDKIQAYQAAIDYFSPRLRPEGSGRLMAVELANFKAALGGLLTTPGGREISVRNLKLLDEYQSKIGQIAADTSLAPAERLKKIYATNPPRLATNANLPIGSIKPGENGSKYRYIGGAANDPDSWALTTTARQIQRFRGGQ